MSNAKLRSAIDNSEEISPLPKRTPKVIEVKRPTVLTDQHMREGHRSIGIVLSTGRKVYLEIDIVARKPTTSKSADASSQLQPVALSSPSSSYKAGFYSYKVDARGVKSERRPVNVPECYLLGYLQVSRCPNVSEDR